MQSEAQVPAQVPAQSQAQPVQPQLDQQQSFQQQVFQQPSQQEPQQTSQQPLQPPQQPPQQFQQFQQPPIPTQGFPMPPATSQGPPLPPQFQQFQNNSNPQYAPPQQHQPSNVGKESGKMFIGGLNWDTTEEGLVAYFSKYGEVTDHTIMRDTNTGKSRGFGFLTFKDPSSVDEVIKTDHILDGKLIDPKRAIAREEQDKVGKIFVGGIDPMVNERDFNEFFSQFGSIIDAQLMIDKDTGRSRGFGFITYDSPDAVDRVTVNKYVTLKGKAMEVKRAEPRGQHQQNQANVQQQQQQQQLPYGNYGAAYGSQYGQTNYQQQPAMGAAYGQQQMSPEMMQEYWRQWYVYQQQLAQQGQGQEEGATGADGEQPMQPMNPQQQDLEHDASGNIPGPPPIGNTGDFGDDFGGEGDRRGNGRGNDRRDDRRGNDRRGNDRRDDRRGPRPNGRGDGLDESDPGNNPHRDGRRMNTPKGPRRAPPSGPAGGARRGGYARRSRNFHPYSKDNGSGGNGGNGGNGGRGNGGGRR